MLFNEIINFHHHKAAWLHCYSFVTCVVPISVRHTVVDALVVQRGIRPADFPQGRTIRHTFRTHPRAVPGSEPVPSGRLEDRVPEGSQEQ